MARMLLMYHLFVYISMATWLHLDMARVSINNIHNIAICNSESA